MPDIRTLLERESAAMEPDPAEFRAGVERQVGRRRSHRRMGGALVALIAVGGLVASLTILGGFDHEPQPPLTSPTVAAGISNGSILATRWVTVGPVPYAGYLEVYRVAADASSARFLWKGRSGALFGGFDFSPDGRRVVTSWLTTHFGPTQIAVLNADGTGRRVIHRCNGTSCAWGPRWSPDGKWIAFESDQRIVVMPATGGSLRTVATCSASIDCRSLEGGLDWSPDSSHIVFGGYDGLGGGMWVVGLAGDADPRRITRCETRMCQGGSRDGLPAWSPDGSVIAFERGRNIFTVRPDGSGVTDLTGCPEVYLASKTKCWARDPVWSPDGRRIALSFSDGTTRRLEIMGGDGSDRRPVPGSEDLRPESWQPVQAQPPVPRTTASPPQATDIPPEVALPEGVRSLSCVFAVEAEPGDLTCNEAVGLGTREVAALGQQVDVLAARTTAPGGSGIWRVEMKGVLIGFVGNTPAASPSPGPPVASCFIADLDVGVDATTGRIVGTGFEGTGQPADCESGPGKPLLNPH